MADRGLIWKNRMVFGLKLLALAPAFLLGLPLQALLIKLPWPGPARWLPVFFHRYILSIIGVRVRKIGGLSPDRPLLILANHLSWLDILVISSVFPASFIAKSEVGLWPGFGTLARLQRSIFVVRADRQKTGTVTDNISARMAAGDVMVLFAEGTTSDGARILPFRSALVGAAMKGEAIVQTLCISYPRRHGLPVMRADLPSIAWYGDMELTPHLPDLIAEGGLEALVNFGAPVQTSAVTNRKTLTRAAETEMRTMYAMRFQREDRSARAPQHS